MLSSSRASTPSPHSSIRTDVVELSGGLTNRNLKITTPDGDVVARLSTPESALLAIDRDHEHANSVAAAASGAAPDVVAYHPEVSVLVVRFVEGAPGVTTMSCCRPTRRASRRCAASCTAARGS